MFLAVPNLTLQTIAFLLLGWQAPGLLLAWLWPLPEETETPARLLVAEGLGLGWMALLALGIHYAPGPISGGMLLGVYGVGALALLAAVVLRFYLPGSSKWSDRQVDETCDQVGRYHTAPTNYSDADSRQTIKLPRRVAPRMGLRFWGWAAALLVIAVALRLPGLGYHELHADEAVLLRQSERSVRGEEDALAEHTKGPGEIAVALAVYRALGTADETTARLPFALMSVGSVMATAWLGRRLFAPASFAPAAGWWAGLLLAFNGFALGLSRIAQYQPAILLLAALAMLAAWEFARSGRRSWLALAAWMSAFGMVFHYEFALLTPALGLAVWMGYRRAENPRGVVVAALLGALLGALLLAVAYVPAIVGPYFATTQGYLANRLGEMGVFNVPFFVEIATFYNSTYFMVGVIALAVTGSVWLWAHARAAAAILTLWWLPFFLLYIFVVRYPGTHFYLLMESWSLLAAIPLARLVQGSVREPLRAGSLAGVAAWLVVCGLYLYLLFFRQQPEYLVNIGQERAPFFWSPYPTPEKPRFGFPIQEGWKTVGVLGEWGYLPRSGQDDNPTYAASDRGWSLRRWYLTPYSRRDVVERPDYLFVARHEQEHNPEFDDAPKGLPPAGYQRIGEVRVRGEARLEIWSTIMPPVGYLTFDSEAFAPMFTRYLAALEPPAQPGDGMIEAARDVAVGETLRLDSAHVERTAIGRGETLHLLLSWEPTAPLPVDYKLFVHVAGTDGRPVAQWDGLPGMNTARTHAWPVGSVFDDHVLLPIPAETPPGTYSLLAGMYDPASGERLGGAAIPLGSLVVE